MVAERHNVITGCVHQLDRGFALRVADIGSALCVVARVDKNDVCALCFIILFECGDLCIQVDLAVHVVGVQNNGLARKIRVCREGCGHKTEHHYDGEKKRKYFLHSILLYFLLRCRKSYLDYTTFFRKGLVPDIEKFPYVFVQNQ